MKTDTSKLTDRGYKAYTRGQRDRITGVAKKDNPNRNVPAKLIALAGWWDKGWQDTDDELTES